MRLGDKVWYCKSIPLENQANGQEYEKPVEVKLALRHFTVMNKANNYKVEELIGELGENKKTKLTIIAQPFRKWYGIFSRGDLFYCNGAKPSKEEDWYGQNANYVVTSVENGNELVKITLSETND